jgi:hypothetical protein
LDAVSQEGMIRLQTGIDGNGEYVEWGSNWKVQSLFLNGGSWGVRLGRKTV